MPLGFEILSFHFVVLFILSMCKNFADYLKSVSNGQRLKTLVSELSVLISNAKYICGKDLLSQLALWVCRSQSSFESENFVNTELV